ncbi:unnamed protein product [Choristocarpus tenellus]
MPRSKWKLPYIELSVLKYLKNKKICWSRRSTILPPLVGTKIKIHNGQKVTTKLITQEIVGHKLGEFSPSRKNYNAQKKKIRKKNT